MNLKMLNQFRCINVILSLLAVTVVFDGDRSSLASQLVPTQLNRQEIQTASSSKKSAIRVKKIKLEQQSKNGFCTIDIEYPQVEGLTNSTIQAQINTYLKTQFLTVNSRLNVKKCLQVKNFLDTVNWLTGYEVTFNKNGILSIDGFTSLTPGAHPTHLPKQFTINIKNGKVYSFKELFKPNSNYLARINRLIPSKIRQNLISISDINQLTLNDIEETVNGFYPKGNYEFYLDETKGLVLCNLYETYALHAITANIKPSEIESIINPQGPLRAF